MASLRSLYPVLDPYAVHRVTVAPGHALYVEECGSAEGIPVAFFHGGPGSGCAASHRRFFDPHVYRIILFDQRGSGRSSPLGETLANRTLDLVSDMEVIRRQLGVDKWLLFGGSWGAALALLYAQSHPGRLLGMVLRGVFLARSVDLHWFFHDLRRLFPQQWHNFADGVAGGGLSDLITAYHSRIHGDDETLALDSARAWSAWGSHVVTWNLAAGREDPKQYDPRLLLAKARLETHYARHRYFIEDNQILRQAGLLPKVPIAIVHGRFDLTCTMESAWLLHRALPGSRLIPVPEAGHLASGPAMVSALIAETDRLREPLSR